MEVGNIISFEASEFSEKKSMSMKKIGTLKFIKRRNPANMTDQKKKQHDDVNHVFHCFFQDTFTNHVFFSSML